MEISLSGFDAADNRTKHGFHIHQTGVRACVRACVCVCGEISLRLHIHQVCVRVWARECAFV